MRSSISGVFGLDLVHFQPGQLVEAQFEDGVDLRFAERIAAAGQPRFAADEHAELLHLGAGEIEGQQLDLGLLAVGGVADDADEFVQVGEGDEIAFQHFRALFRLAQFEFRAADHHFAPVLDVAIDQLLEPQRLGPAMVDGQRIDAKRRLQRGVLVQVVDDHLRQRVPLDFDDHARVLVRLVAHGGDVRDDSSR